MAEQTSGANFKGIDVEVITEGPEAQDGHEIGSDVLHSELTTAMEEVFKRHE